MVKDETALRHNKLQSLQRRLLQTNAVCNVDAYVTESTKIRNLQNKLTFSLSFGCSLGALSSIVISGIPETITPNSPIAVRGTITASMGANTATVATGANGFDLTVVLNRDLASGCGHTLEVTLPNPPSRQEGATDVQVSIIHAETVLQSNWGVYTVKSDASLARPARILQGELSNTFITRRVKESSGVSGELNVLTFTLQPDFPLPVGTIIAIDGLAGSLTPSNYWYNNSASLSTEVTCSASSEAVEWEPSAGLCRILNPNGVCINPEGQPESSCSFHRMQVSGTDGDMFGGVGEWVNYGTLTLNCTKLLYPGTNSTDCMGPSSAVDFSVTLRNPALPRTGQNPQASARSSAVSIDAQTLALLPDAPYPFVLGGREANGFVAAVVSEETDMIGVENIVSFALTANVNIAAGSMLRIFGLTGTQTGGTTLGVQGASAAVFTAQTAEWDRLAGTLKLLVASNVAAGNALRFSLALTNQQYAINARRVYASMSGATPIPQREVTGAVLASGGEIRWRAAVVSESSEVRGAVNTLTLRFIPSVPLPNATQITLSGLGGTTLLSTSVGVPLGGADAARFSLGRMDASAGTLVVTAHELVSTFCATEISIDVLNPSTEQTAASLGLSASGILPIPRTALICKEVPCQVLRAAVNASWDVRAVSESSALIGDSNTITISLSPALDLPPGTSVTIAGLTGSATATNPALALSGTGAALFGGTGSWDQGTGSLVLATGFEWPHTTTSVFTIALTNPSSQQNATTPTISGVADGTVACATYGVCSRNYLSMAVGPELMTGSVLSASDKPSVIISDIAETSAVRTFVNTLTVTVAVNRQAPVGGTLAVEGLTGTQTYQQPWTLMGADADKFNQTLVNFNVTGGRLTAHFIQAVPASQALVLSFRVVNGQSAQTAVTPTVSVRDASGGLVASGPFTSSVLAFADSRLSMSITVSESTNQIGNENEIVIDMKPNHAVPVGTILTMSGLTNARRTTAGASFTDGRTTSLGGSEAALFSSSQGTWISASALKITVAAEIPSDCISTFSLEGVYNARAPGLSSVIEVGVFGTAFDFCGLGNVTNKGVVSTLWTNITTCVQPLVADCSSLSSHFGLGQCAYPSTTAQRTATQAGLDSSGAVLTANGTNSFVVALASESSDLSGRDNIITFVLRPRGIIRSGEVVSISGLDNSLTSTTAALALGGTHRSRFRSGTGIFDANAGLLTVTARIDLPSTEDTEFSITLQNPKCPCVTVTTFPCPNNASLTCSSSTARAATIPSIEVTELPYSLAKTSMSNAVLKGDTNATWLRLSVFESHSVQDVAALVTFRLSSSHAIPAGEVLTITGLTGTNSETIPLSSPDRSWFTPPVVWNQGTGEMRIVATSDSPAGLSLDFTACIVQRSTVQLTRSPTIQSTTVFNVPTSIPVSGTGSLLAATERIRFLVASLHESSRVQGAFNTISISLRPNVDFGQDATLTISGMAETSAGLTDQLLVLAGPGSSVFGSNATLTGSGLLIFTIAQTLSAEETTLVQFTYQNPSSASSRVTSRMILSGTWRGATTHECSLSQSPVTLVAASVGLSVDNQDTPGGLTSPTWTTASVVESSKVRSTSNTLEFRLRPSHDVRQQTPVVIDGVRGTATASTACLPLGGLHPDLFTGSCGSWNVDGTLSLTVASGKTLLSTSDTVISITVNNPSSSQAARTPGITAGGGGWTRTSGSPPLAGQMTVVGGTGILAASETARWERAWIEQDSCARGGINQLTVVLQTNAPLLAASSVVISGLDLATTPSSTIDVGGLSSALFGAVGSWSDAGDLTLDVSAGTGSDPGQVLVFSFQLGNPTTLSTGVTPTVRAFDSSGTLVPSLEMTSPDGVPPRVLVTGMDPLITGTILQSSAVFGAPNTLDLRLTTNTRLILGDSVTVSGLAGSQTTSGQIALGGADAARFSSAAYDQCRGELILVVAAADIPPDTTAALTVILINPAMPRESAPSFALSTRTAVQELMGRVLSPSVQPTLVVRNISGASPVLGNTNAVTVTLQANHVLQAEHRITLSGFTSALEVDGAVLAVSTLQTSLLPPSVNFSRASSSIALVMPVDVPAFTTLTFAFPLTNPATTMYGREPLISTGPFPFIPQLAMHHQADVLAPTREGAWTTATIADTEQVQGASAVVTISVTADTELPPGTVVVVSHLIGPYMSSMPQVTSTPTEMLNARAAWDACAGELSVAVNGTLPAGNTLTFSFTAGNPFSALSPGNNPLIRAESSTITIPATSMTLASAAFLSTLQRPSWVSATVSESVLVADESNLITISLLPSATLAQGSVVVISGLVGTQTVDDAAISLQGSGRHAFSSASGSWQQATGTLTLSVNTSIPGCTDSSCSATEFAFTVKNPAVTQSPAATVAVSAMAPTPGLELNKTVMTGSPVLGAASIYSVAATVVFSSEVAGAYTEINVILTPAVDISAGEAITLAGMSAFSSASGTVELSGLQSSYFGFGGVASRASWTSCGDRLVMEVMPGVTFGPSTADPSVELQFTLLNPAIRTTTSMTLTIGSRPIQTLRTNVVLGHKDPTWTSSFASQSNTVMTQLNTITVGFQANVILTPSTVVTVSGLTGSQTADSTTLSLLGSDAALFTNSQADWNQNAGTLKITVASGTYITARAMTTVQVELVNSDVTVAGTNFVTLESTCASSALGCVMVPLQQKQIASTILAPVTQPSFTLRILTQTSNAQRETSTIAVTLTANAALPAGATITVSGLKDYSTPSNGTLPVSSSLGIASGAWDRLEGTMSVVVPSGGFTSGQSIAVSFTLTNGDFYLADHVPTQTIAVSDALGFVIEPQEFQTSAIAAFSHTGSFTVAQIQQDTQAQGVTSQVTLDVQPSYDVPAGSVLTISGLRGSRTPSTAALPLYGNGAGFYSDFGNWDQREGRLELTMASVMSNRYPTRVSFDLINPARAQLSVEAYASTTVIPSQLMTVVAVNGFSASVLTGAVQPQLSASITETTQLQGHANTITVSLELNARVRSAALVVISNLPSTQTPRNLALPIYGPASSLFGGALEWDPCAGEARLNAISGLPIATALVFNFTVVNARTAQPRPDWCAAELATCTQVTVFGDGGEMVVLPTAVPSGVLAASEALALISNTVVMATFAPGELNEVLMQIESNAQIPQGALLVASGFAGAISPPDLIPLPGADEVVIANMSRGLPGFIPVRNASVDLTGNTTIWDPAQGTLTFEVQKTISSRTPLTFLFSLRNPLPNLPRSQPQLEIVSPFFTIQRQPLEGPAFEVDTVPPTLLSLTLVTFSDALSSVRSVNMSLALSEPSQAVCLLQRASAVVPSVEEVRSLGVHVQPSAGALTNLSDVGLFSAPPLRSSAGWVELGPVFSGIRHAVYCHYRDLAQIPNEAPAEMLESTVFTFTTPASYLPKGAGPSKFGGPTWTLILGLSSLALLAAARAGEQLLSRW